MIDCQKVAAQLLEYIDRELDQNNMKEVEKHLDLCRGCFEVSEFETLLKKHLQEKTNHCCPDRVKSRIQKLIEKF